MPYVSLTNPQTNHFERVRKVIEGRNMNPGADTARLALSYRRALEDYHLDPGAVIGPRILTSQELRDIRQGEEALLLASGECLPRLHDMIREAGYCVLLSNADGVTIDYCVDHDHRNEFKRAGLHLGSCWSEGEEGTCGIAVTLLDKTPITVHKTDHFRATFTGLTCSAAPIFAPEGELIGVLDASAVLSPDSRDSQRLVNRLVQQSAIWIEDAYFLKTNMHCWILLAHHNRHFVEAQPEILIAVNGDGNVVAANRCAKARVPELAGLGGPLSRALPRHVSELFDIRAEQLFAMRPGQNLLSLRLAGNTYLYARVRTPLQRNVAKKHNLNPKNTNVASVLLDEDDIVERTRIVAALTQTHWTPELAATLLGISRATLYRRLASLNIRPPHRQ
ncbi:sigma-54-dependent Fis family transcriptional regulator [Glaciimonas sp. PCH181]|uniref:sigma-54-dependent Fis family transcriptional regulator n=1 Tax=Glaciimonas sp. PCH181 TaxID=2133943 RepID=UPI000D3ABCBD|nr:helix-turn-helix domain-containing protein [Glaciimonas sp. PCH181]PUA17193.1 Fis family transcriptional regulator [Glaciimonas sp. PCH181]